MKKFILLLILNLTIISNLHSDATKVESKSVMTSGGSMAGIWDDVQNPINVSYNPLSKNYVTNATHTGSGYSKVIVYGTDITKIPVVGAGTDGVLVSSSNYYDSRRILIGKIFIFQHPKDMSGEFVSFYSAKNKILSSVDRFLRYP